MNVATPHDPKRELEIGVGILSPFLQSLGFTFSLDGSGSSSGGRCAWGRFLRDDRSIHLHHRWGLGIVEYHRGEQWISHEDWLRFLNAERESKFLWMRLDAGLERYRALKFDLETFCSDFLTGEDRNFDCAVNEAGVMRLQWQQELRVRSTGDLELRQRARLLFRERRYQEVVVILDSLNAPEMLSRSELAMRELARKRANASK